MEQAKDAELSRLRTELAEARAELVRLRSRTAEFKPPDDPAPLGPGTA